MPDIKRLEPGDAAEWIDLRQALWPDTDAVALRAEVAGYRPDTGDTVALGAFVDGKLSGFAEASIRSTGSGCHIEQTPWLEGIYVAPSMRGQGMAAALVKAVEDWARLKGFDCLASDARIDNDISIDRHGKWGFAQVERVVIFRKTLT